jgi:thymidylate synthase (FAD)
MLMPSIIDHTCRTAFEAYRVLLGNGVPRELARIVLPVATYSHMFATVNLLNLLKFLTLRCDDHAQYEIRVYADALKTLACTVCPVAIATFEEAE